MKYLYARYTIAAVAVVALYAVSPTVSAQYGEAPAPATDETKGEIHSGVTPRTADGRPDLSGIWVPTRGGVADRLIIEKDEQGRTTKLLFAEPDADFSKGDAQQRALRAAAPNQPPYKPELMAKVKYLDEHTNEYDGALHCMPPGVPRMGPPQQIVQVPGKVVLLYEGGEASINTFRVVPTDGRAHHEGADPTYLGDSVGRWDGGTLVVDVTDFIDTTWLSADGHFHSSAMHVVERFTRDGENLKYEVTVEDPDVFTRSWTMTPRLLKLNKDPNAAIEEDPPCVEKDASHLVTHEHH